ncbi:MAG TPA: GNAT family protein [Thermomicrobiales bacterium]|nr:GNAT family protein [Thermomicrobiales bacterium]
MDRDHTAPTINISGEKVALGPLDRSIISLQTAWINDFATTRTLGHDAQPRSLAVNEDWFEHMAASGATIAFTIYDLSDMAPVGTVNLFRIDHQHGTCTLGISIMPPERRGRGLGTDAVRLITDYAFNDLGMHNVQLTTLEFNIASIKAYRKVGFQEYGRRREAWLHSGRYWDLIYMDILAPEHQAARLRHPERSEESPREAHRLQSSIPTHDCIDRQ